MDQRAMLVLLLVVLASGFLTITLRGFVLWEGSEFMTQTKLGTSAGGMFTVSEWFGVVMQFYAAPITVTLYLLAVHFTAKAPWSRRTRCGILSSLGGLFLALSVVFLCTAKPYATATVQYTMYFGSIAFCVGCLMTCLTAVAAARVAWSTDAPEDIEQPLVKSASVYPTTMPKLRWPVVVFLVAYLPAVIALTMVLPNLWNKFSWSSEDSTDLGGSIKGYVSQSGDGPNRAAINIHVADLHDGTPVYAKLWVDVLIYYTFLYVITLSGVLSQCIPGLHRLAHLRITRFTLGQLWLCICLGALVFGWMWYWLKVHKFMGMPGMQPVEKWARSLGQLAALFLSLLLLPLPRSSLWGMVFGVSWEAGVKVHRWLGYGVFIASAMHQFLFWKVFENDNAKQLDPYGQTGRFPHDIFAVPMKYHADNFTIPTMILTWWVAVVLILILSLNWVRRNRFEWFYYAHHFGLIFLGVALLHATSLWYYILGGLPLWFFDRALRFSKGVRKTHVVKVVAHGSGPSSVTEIEVDIQGRFEFTAGQFAFLNIPEVSLLEWHPFTISSSPTDGRVTFHIKAMAVMRPSGPDTNTWTGRLHKLATASLPITVSIDGPYGTPPCTDNYDTVVYCVGGIGVTPANSAVRSVLAKYDGQVPVPRTHFLWVARTPEVIEPFRDTLVQLEPLESRARVTGSVYLTHAKSDVRPMHCVVPSTELDAADCLRREILDCTAESTGRTLVFVCGPPGLAGLVLDAAREAGADYHTETFCL